MMEEQEINSNVWTEIIPRDLARCTGYSNSAFLHHRVRIDGIVYRQPGPLFDEAFKKEQMWAQLQYDRT